MFLFGRRDTQRKRKEEMQRIKKNQKRIKKLYFNEMVKKYKTFDAKVYYKVGC